MNSDYLKVLRPEREMPVRHLSLSPVSRPFLIAMLGHQEASESQTAGSGAEADASMSDSEFLY